MLSRRNLAALAGLSTLARPAIAQPAWTPARPVTLVVPYPAGGPTDLIARMMAQEFSASLGQPMVVENVAGGAGAIGTRRVAQGPKDGTMLVFATNQTHATNISLIPDGGGYHPIRDFAPIALLVDLQHILVVRNELAAKDVPVGGRVWAVMDHYDPPTRHEYIDRQLVPLGFERVRAEECFRAGAYLYERTR